MAVPVTGDNIVLPTLGGGAYTSTDDLAFIDDINLRWALAFLGSGLGGSSVNAAESAPRQPVRLTDRLASLQGPSALCASARR